MAKQDLLVPARYYRRLDEVLARHQIDFRAILQQMSLPSDALDAPDCSMRLSQVERFIAIAERLSQRSDLGFDLGSNLTLSSHSYVGFGMLASPTVFEALRFVSRYFTLVMPSFRLRLVSSPGREELHFTPTVAMSHQCLAFHLDAIAMAARRDICDLIGHAVPVRLHFSMKEPKHVDRYGKLSDVTAFFGVNREPGITLIFDMDLRDIRLPMHDKNALKVAEQRCEGWLHQTSRARHYSDWVSMTLREIGNGGPSLAEMARLLNLSQRTLNRYLQREGSTYRELAAKAQFEMASERLSSSALSVTEIAYSLGFTELSNFTRAFRQFAGCSPSEFRAAARGKAAASPAEQAALPRMGDATL
jgi:AraC-like DNA-binding protein